MIFALQKTEGEAESCEGKITVNTAGRAEVAPLRAGKQSPGSAWCLMQRAVNPQLSKIASSCCLPLTLVLAFAHSAESTIFTDEVDASDLVELEAHRFSRVRACYACRSASELRLADKPSVEAAAESSILKDQ
jgi:hypothetical protein